MHPLTRAHHPFSSLDVVMMFEHVPMSHPLTLLEPAQAAVPTPDDSLRLAAVRCARAKTARDVRCRSTRPEDRPALLWVLLRTLVPSSERSEAPAFPEATQRGALVATEGALAEVICLRRASSTQIAA